MLNREELLRHGVVRQALERVSQDGCGRKFVHAHRVSLTKLAASDKGLSVKNLSDKKCLL